MPATATSLTRSTLEAINTLSPGDRRVLNENELAQRWGTLPMAKALGSLFGFADGGVMTSTGPLPLRA